MKKTVIHNVRRIITEQQLRPREVEQSAGMKPGVISRMINGKRKVYADELVPVANALGVEVDELFISATQQ